MYSQLFSNLRSVLRVSCVFAAALVGAAHAANITGLTANPPNPTAGQQVQFTISMSGTGQCGVRLVYGNGEPADNVLSGAGGGASISKNMAKAGTYNVQAIGSPTLHPACTGQASMVLVVKDAPAPSRPNLVIGVLGNNTVPNCPAPPYSYKEQIRDPQTGKLNCLMTAPACPTGWKKASYSDATGQLQCVIETNPTCQAGYDGIYANGVLKCTPKPQPKVACPAGALPANPWGTSYYTEGWSALGCSVNLAPPK